MKIKGDEFYRYIRSFKIQKPSSIPRTRCTTCSSNLKSQVLSFIDSLSEENKSLCPAYQPSIESANYHLSKLDLCQNCDGSPRSISKTKDSITTITNIPECDTLFDPLLWVAAYNFLVEQRPILNRLKNIEKHYREQKKKFKNHMQLEALLNNPNYTSYHKKKNKIKRVKHPIHPEVGGMFDIGLREEDKSFMIDLLDKLPKTENMKLNVEIDFTTKLAEGLISIKNYFVNAVSSVKDYLLFLFSFMRDQVSDGLGGIIDLILTSFGVRPIHRDELEECELELAPHDGPVPQSGFKTAGLATAVLGFAAYKRYLSQYLSRTDFLNFILCMGEAKSAGEVITDTISPFINIAENIFNFVSEFFGMPYRFPTDLFVFDRTKPLMKRALELRDHINKRSMSPENIATAATLLKLEMEEMISTSKIRTGSKDRLQYVIKTFKEIEDYVKKNCNPDNSMRVEPAMLVILGNSGVGKSTIIEGAAFSILTSIAPDHEAAAAVLENPARYLYSRKAETKYNDGVNSLAHAWLYDDLFQLRDHSSSPNPEVFEIIRLGNGTSFQLNMSDIPDKKGTFAKPKIVVATTNEHCWNHTTFPSIVKPQAVTRRFNYAYIQVPKPDYCKPHTRKMPLLKRELDLGLLHSLRPESCSDEILTDIYDFYAWDFTIGIPLDKPPITYEKVLENVIEQYRFNERKFEKVKACHQKMMLKFASPEAIAIYNKRMEMNKPEAPLTLESLSKDLRDKGLEQFIPSKLITVKDRMVSHFKKAAIPLSDSSELPGDEFKVHPEVGNESMSAIIRARFPPPPRDYAFINQDRRSCCLGTHYHTGLSVRCQFEELPFGFKCPHCSAYNHLMCAKWKVIWSVNYNQHRVGSVECNDCLGDIYGIINPTVRDTVPYSSFEDQIIVDESEVVTEVFTDTYHRVNVERRNKIIKEMKDKYDTLYSEYLNSLWEERHNRMSLTIPDLVFPEVGFSSLYNWFITPPPIPAPLIEDESEGDLALMDDPHFRYEAERLLKVVPDLFPLTVKDREYLKLKALSRKAISEIKDCSVAPDGRKPEEWNDVMYKTLLHQSNEAVMQTMSQMAKRRRRNKAVIAGLVALGTSLLVVFGIYKSYKYGMSLFSKSTPVKTDMEVFTESKRDDMKGSRKNKHPYHSNRVSNAVGQSGQQNYDKADALLQHSVYILAVKGIRYGAVTFVKDRIFMMPKHFEYAMANAFADDEENIVDLYHPIDKRKTQINLKDCKFSKEITADEYKSFAEEDKMTYYKDVSFVFITKNVIHPHRNIVDSFMPAAAIKKGDKMDIILPVVRGSGIAYLTPTADIGSSTNYPAWMNGTVPDPECDIRCVSNQLTYYAPTQHGDCGFPCIAQGVKFPKPTIAGFHTASAGNPKAGLETHICYGFMVPREMVEEAIKDFESIGLQSLSVTESKTMDVRPECYFGLQVIGRSKNIIRPTKTKIVPSKITQNEQWISKYPLTTAPAKLTPFYNKDGVKVDPLELALSPYSHDQLHIDDHAFEIAKEHCIQDMLKDHRPRPREPIILTMKAAVDGDNYPGLRHVDRVTSCGYDAESDIEYDTKIKEIGKSGEFEEHLFPVISGQVNETIAQAKNGVRQLHVSTVNQKDQTIALEKVELGKGRVFMCCSLRLFIATKMYFGDFSRHLILNRIKNGFTTGIDPHSEWGDLAIFLNSEEWVSFIAGDYGKFDARQLVRLSMIYLEAANRWYKLSRYWQPEDDMVRNILFMEVVDCRVLINGKICQLKHSVPSGHFLTALITSSNNKAELSTHCVRQIDRYKLEGCSLHNIHMVVHGDDNIVSVPKSLIPYINQESTTQGIKDLFNMEYTAEDKSSVLVGTRSIFEITFLKRSFRIDEDGNWTAPLDLNSIINSLQYYKKSHDEDTIINNAENALAELSKHGRKVFGLIEPDISRVISTVHGRGLRNAKYENAKQGGGFAE